MAEEFRIRLTADDEIAKRANAAVDAINQVEKADKRREDRLRRINDARARYAREARRAAFEEMATADKLTLLKDRQLRVEQLIARAETNPARLAALRLRLQMISAEQAALRGSGLPPVLARTAGMGGSAGRGGILGALGKLVPGGEKGAALAGAIPGAGAVGMGAGVAALGVVQGIRSLIQEAMTLDARAEETAASIANLTRFSDGAIESLAGVGNAIKLFAGLIKKYLADDLARQIETVKAMVGAAASAWGKLAEFLPGRLGGFGTRMREWGNEVLGTSMARMGGGGTGDQDVARAEQRLKEAQERRRERDRTSDDAAKPKDRRRAFSVDTPSGYRPEVDELTRIGLFRGGSPNGMVDLQRQANQKLDTIVNRLERLPSGISSGL